MESAPNLLSLRLFATTTRGHQRLASIYWSATDESLYIKPFAPSGRFLYGSHVLPAGVSSKIDTSVGFSADVEAARAVKLSLHASGQGHIRGGTGAPMAGPVQFTPLRDLRGEHFATILVDRFANIPVTDTSDIGRQSRRSDIAFTFGDAPSGRIVLYANGQEAAFRDEPQIVLKLARPGLAVPLHVGIRGIVQEALSAGDADNWQGVAVMGGWDVRLALLPVSMPILVVRGV